MLTKEEPAHKLVDLRELLAPPSVRHTLGRQKRGVAHWDEQDVFEQNFDRTLYPIII